MSSKDRILCIDDDQDQLVLLESALTRLGHSVVTNTSAAAALEELSRSHCLARDIASRL
jgi:CheY-like chemotaxis protein